MKKIFFISLVLFLSITAFSQENIYDVNMEIKTEPAHFPGGDDELHKILFRNITYSEEAIQAKVRGQLMVSVDIEADSTVSNVSFMNSIGYGIEEQIESLIKSFKFAPKIMNGRVFKGDIMYNFVIQAH